MVMKCSALCLVALALLGSFCEAQWPSKPAYQQPRPPVRQEPSKQLPSEPQQSKQSFEKPLTWTYPEDPKPEPVPEVPFELRHPVAPATVAVKCREKDAHVEVMKDMFLTGQLINAADLLLGNCGAVAEDTNAQVLIFEADLHDCGSTLMMTEESLIYTYTLNYNPQPLGGLPVLRTTQAAVIVECHYPRKHNVSSLPLNPVWVPFSAVKVAEEFLYFTLKLMMEDFQHERPIHQYFLGDIIHIEATVFQYFHVPLRVYVDNCVATNSPDVNSSPKYVFIENHGCFVDARLTGSKSRFVPRSAENKLQFELEAFRFQNAASDLLYITCHLKASSASLPIDEGHRACSYSNGWKEASGVDPACSSCESGSFGPVHTGSTGVAAQPNVEYGSWGGSGSSSRKVRDVSQKEVFEWEGDVTLGPIPVQERTI